MPKEPREPKEPKEPKAKAETEESQRREEHDATLTCANRPVRLFFRQLSEFASSICEQLTSHKQ